ncbi:unnamed protein product, partial [Amoebophrya sp. A25]
QLEHRIAELFTVAQRAEDQAAERVQPGAPRRGAPICASCSREDEGRVAAHFGQARGASRREPTSRRRETQIISNHQAKATASEPRTMSGSSEGLRHRAALVAYFEATSDPENANLRDQRLEKLRAAAQKEMNS